MSRLIYLFNPDKEDFVTQYDIDGNSQPHTYVLHAGEIEGFEKPIADHIQKHLADKLVWKHGIKTNYEDQFAQTMKDLIREPKSYD